MFVQVLLHPEHYVLEHWVVEQALQLTFLLHELLEFALDVVVELHE